MARRFLIYLTGLAMVGSVALPLTPVPLTLFKLAWLAAIGITWSGLTALCWNRRRARTALLALPLLATFPFCLPGRPINPTELRDDYVRRLRQFEGTPYVWGGEGRRGIDCSGLPRRAYRDALFANGLTHANSRAFRLFAQQWWFDASARALGNGYRNDTVALETTGTLREIDYAALQPGDLAVTTNGVHLLAYLGNDTWIQADPGAGAVITMNGRSSPNGWLRSNVTTHRWRELQNEGQR